MTEFEKFASDKQTELRAQQAQHVRLCEMDEKILTGITNRLAALERSEKSVTYTVDQMLKFMNAKLLKPQRLVSLSYEEEERRALRGWWRFDWKLNLACFRPLEELGALVRRPDLFREKVRELVMYMSDEYPMWLKRKLQKRKKRKKKREQAQRLQEEREAETSGQHEAEQRGNTEASGANPEERHTFEIQLLPILKLFAENAPN